MKKVTVSIVIITTTIILLPQLTMLGKNICTTNNIIAIANGINLLILTFEKTYFLPKNDTPKVKANNNIKYNIDDILNTRSSKYRMVFELCGASDSKLIFLSPYTYNKSESILEFFNKYDVTFVDRTYNYVGHQIEDVSTQTKAQKLFNTTNISYKSNAAGIIKAMTILPYLNDSTII